MSPNGSYASGRLFPAERLITVPRDLLFEDAAAVLFKRLPITRPRLDTEAYESILNNFGNPECRSGRELGQHRP
jgi:hypothetical protein